MGCEGLPFAGEKVVSKHVQSPASYDRRIKLANRPRRRIARIRKSGFPFFGTLSINPFKNSSRQVSLTAHFDLRSGFAEIVAEFQRHTTNCPHICRHILAAKTIAASDAPRENSVVVMNRE